MINVMIEIEEKVKDKFELSIYDNGDTIKHTKLEMEVCEDIYEVLKEYLYGDSAQETIKEIITTMKNQKEK